MTSRGPDSRLRDALAAAVLRILKPLVRVLLRHGVPFAAFAELARRAYVDVARNEFRIGGRRQSDSRVAVVTGLSRKEVRRIANLPPPSADEETGRYSRSARVLTGWATDPDFQDESGQPRLLDAATDFGDLVRRYSGDMPARAVLDELRRVGAVDVRDDGRVQLRARAYVPAGSDVDTLEILGRDVAALADTIDHNMTSGDGERWYQRKVLYDNLPEESLERLRQLAREQGQRLLEQLNTEMQRQDRDSSPGAGGHGRKTAMVGVYWNESDTADETGEDAGQATRRIVQGDTP